MPTLTPSPDAHLRLSCEGLGFQGPKLVWDRHPHGNQLPIHRIDYLQLYSLILLCLGLAALVGSWLCRPKTSKDVFRRDYGSLGYDLALAWHLAPLGGSAP